jgi:glycosyltransferase involved in cell wall biosynthesis
MPLLESLAAKTPMVLSNIPVFQEVAHDAAIYIDTDNSPAYAGVIEKLLTDSKDRQILITKGNERLKHYSWDDNAQLIIAYCRDLLEEK